MMTVRTLCLVAVLLLAACAPAPTLTPVAPEDRLPVVFSDDGSPDGTAALLYLLSEPRIDLRAVTISHGEAHPDVYIQHVGGMLEQLGRVGIPLGAGQAEALVPGEGFPAFMLEGSDGFWGLRVDNPDKVYPVEDAADLIAAQLNAAEKPAAVFASGAYTDLALALRLDPAIRDKISAVYLMGGAVYVPGNLADLSGDRSNLAAEWNVYIDPLAAAEVLAAGVPVVLVPLDATNQAIVTQRDLKAWGRGGEPGDWAAGLYGNVIGGANAMGIWDVMTAAVMVHPGLCELTPLRLEVVTTPGDTYGQTKVVEGEPNVQVCLNPDVDGIKQAVADAFAASK